MIMHNAVLNIKLQCGRARTKSSVGQTHNAERVAAAELIIIYERVKHMFTSDNTHSLDSAVQIN